MRRPLRHPRPGDEIALEFDATHLPPLAPGWERTLFFESNGRDKDADRNTFEAQQMEPLPFRGDAKVWRAAPG